MSRTTKWVLGLLFLFVVLFVGIVILIVRVANAIPENAVLVLELGGEIDEQRPGGVAELTEPSVTVLHDVLGAIDRAKTDDRIKGLVVKITPLDTGRATIQEIHSRLLDFRTSKKPSICYLNSDWPDNPMYYLATGCEQVWLVPTSTLGSTGMMAQALFLRGTLDKLKIYPDLYHIADYKTAMNTLTEKKFTPAHREMTTWLLRSAYEQYVADASSARGIEKAQFDQTLKQGPYLAQIALDNQLVDRLAYWDEVQQFFKDKHREWHPVRLGRYVKEIENEGDETIAVVHATGTIIVGKSDFSPMMGHIMGSDSVAADIRRARQNKAVKAIILRVDSGGGSAVGSEIIRREVELARKEKPVVVSMSDVAGSGGYWISMSANKIVADPSTLTASIGVVYGKLNLAGLRNLLGLSLDHVATSENATLLWSNQNFTPAQRETIKRFMDDIYQNFIKGVAATRNKKPQEVDKIGQGRVFTGTQAKDLGLVDEIGGFDRALAITKELAKIDASKPVRLLRFPEHIPWWKQLLDKESQQTVPLGATPLGELRRLQRVLEPIQARVPIEIELR